MPATANCLCVLPSWVHYCHSAATTTQQTTRTRNHGLLVSHMRAHTVMPSNNVTGFCPTCIRSSTSLLREAHQSFAHCIIIFRKMNRPAILKMSSCWALHCFLHPFMCQALRVETYICQEEPGSIIGMGQNILARSGPKSLLR